MYSILPPLASCRRLLAAAARGVSGYTAMERGALYTPEYKLYVRGPQGPISAFHDVPLHAGAGCDEFHMIVEIPRWTNAKMEIDKKQKLNPIVQDTKNGSLRFVANVFPHHGYMWNYGALPQTWEDPGRVDSRTGAKGDNDPLDVCEIGSRVHARGTVIRVKPLGLLGLIDEGETDWKLLVIDADDPLASGLRGLADVESRLPGLLAATRQWLRDYKLPQGKPRNSFAFGGEFKDRQFAIDVVSETHEQWRRLLASGADGVAVDALTVGEPQRCVSVAEAERIVAEAGEPAPASCLPQHANVWHFV